MDREVIISIVDAVLQIAALLIALLCAKNIFSAFKNKYVFINSKKATAADEPIGYWLVILSWLVVLAVFVSFLVSSISG